MDIYDRVVTVLKGGKPDRLPFCTRLEIWHRGLQRTGHLPERFATTPLTQIHAQTRTGQEKYFNIHNMRLRGVEIIARLDGVEYFHEKDPVVDTFPRLYSLVDFEKPGTTDIDIITPKGTLTVRHQMLQSMIDDGMHPYLNITPIKDASDYPAFEYVIENAEFVYRFDEYRALQAEIGKVGYVVPMTERMPFQQLLIDCVGEISLFYLMNDDPQLFDKLMRLLDEKLQEALRGLANFEGHMIEFPDNLEAQMTNPNFFRDYSLPYYQKYADLVHGFGLKMSSHTDGNLKPLLGLLKESGLDVCESISPAPLTVYTFDEVWKAWEGGPIIWAGIPSPILEPRTSEADFQAYIDHMLELIDEPRIILGVGDMVLPINTIERVEYIAQRIEAHQL
jgi:hypothetical protein